MEFYTSYLDVQKAYLVSVHKLRLHQANQPVLGVFCVENKESKALRENGEENTGVKEIVGLLDNYLQKLWELPTKKRKDLGARRTNAARFVDLVADHFEQYWNNYSHAEICAFFAVGEEAFFAWRGDYEIKLINKSFDKIHIKVLSHLSENICQLNIERVQIEAGVKLILGNASFFQNMKEQVLKECMHFTMPIGAKAVEKRTAELEAYLRGRGNKISTTILPRANTIAETEVTRAGVKANSELAIVIAIAGEESRELQELLGRHGYQKGKLIGAGAFGRVYRCKQKNTGRTFACKVAESSAERKLLQNEASLQSQIHHPLFASYEAFLEGEGMSVLLMEYRTGLDLSHSIIKKLSIKRIYCILSQIADGLTYLHHFSEPILFRDLKPQNVRVNLWGQVTLLDLGCACPVTKAHLSHAGNRAFSAPEQFETGEHLPGIYSDVYAWGKLGLCLLQEKKISYKVRTYLEDCINVDPLLRPAQMQLPKLRQ